MSARHPISALAVLGAMLGVSCGGQTGDADVPSHGRPASTDPAVSTRPFTLARSVRGRPIVGHELGVPSARTRVLVVGDIHGNEPAGIAIARRLDRGPARTGLDLWVIDDLNPDGVIAGTRQNAHGVDLNRNFPYRWRPAGSPFDQQYPGPRPLSEPEARAAYRLIVRIRPAVTIWFHQPLGLVDDSGGSRRIEAGFARSAGLPLRPLTRYPGGAMGWQDHALPSTTAFVVELAPGRLSGPALARITNAVLGLAR